MDTKRMPDADICDVLNDMGEMMRRVELLVKANESDLWYAVLKKIEGIQEGKLSWMGRIASKELILPRPSERNYARVRCREHDPQDDNKEDYGPET